MKKIIATSSIVIAIAIMATSGINTPKLKMAKANNISKSNSIHNGNEIASAD